MARITVEDCLENIENRFILVHMADKRTRQLLKGVKPLVHAPENREVVQALREIAAKQVSLEDDTVQSLKEGNFIKAEED